MITIAYCTARKDPGIEWFFQSLLVQWSSILDIIVVDHWLWYEPEKRREEFRRLMPFDFRHVPPQPSNWIGPERLTKNEYFDAPTARNTALIEARGTYVIFVDDCTCLLPGWLQWHLAAAHGGYNLAGCSLAGGGLKLERGLPVAFECRGQRNLPYHHLEPCNNGGAWFTHNGGVHLAHALAIDGFDGIYARYGCEDCDFGNRLHNAGYKVMIAPHCLIMEDKDRQHSQENLENHYAWRRWTNDPNDPKNPIYNERLESLIGPRPMRRTQPVLSAKVADARNNGGILYRETPETDLITGLPMKEL